MQSLDSKLLWGQHQCSTCLLKPSMIHVSLYFAAPTSMNQVAADDASRVLQGVCRCATHTRIFPSSVNDATATGLASNLTFSTASLAKCSTKGWQHGCHSSNMACHTQVDDNKDVQQCSRLRHECKHVACSTHKAGHICILQAPWHVTCKCMTAEQEQCSHLHKGQHGACSAEQVGDKDHQPRH